MLCIVAVMGLASSPASAEIFSPHATVLGQSVDDIRNMSMDEVTENLHKWKIPILIGMTALTAAFLMAGGLLKPGGFTAAGLRDVKNIPAAIWLFAALIVFLAMASSGTVLERVQFYENSNLTEEDREIVVRLVGYVFGAVTGLGMLYMLSKSCDKGGLRMGPLDIAVGAGCFAIAWPLIELASEGGALLQKSLTDSGGYDNVAHPVLERIVDSPKDPWSWALIAGILIGAPIVQELIYRVFVQTAALRLTGSAWFSILVGAVSFALMERVLGAQGDHVPWHALLPLFALGLASGIAYERTKRVGVPIAMHACFNGFNLLLAFMFTPGIAEPGAGAY